jgi:hypothetical protein
MNTIQMGTVALLKSAVLQQSCPLPADFDLEAAYPALKRHHMDALLYEGAVLCGISKELPVMKRLFQSYCRSLMASEGQMGEVHRLTETFDSNGIDYMPLKGCKMKALYPKPELRIMGDADILIRMEQYGKIVPIMEALGFRPGVESDHELQWFGKSLFVELHKRVIPSYNKDFYAYFGEGWQLAKRRSGTCYGMEQEDEMVYLFTHFAKHYRDGGIGCRHLVDLWVFRGAHPDMAEETIKAALDKIQLREFYENICRLIDVWFTDAPGDEKMDFITDYLFASGSWGTKENHIASSGVKDQGGKKGGRLARISYIFRIVFAGVDTLKYKYTILQKAPWMLPLVWLYRPFYKLFSGTERKSLGHHKTNLRILSPETVRSRQEALQYVGLDYHF